MNERDVFMAALEIEEVAERSAYLGQVCASEATLRQRAETTDRSQERGHAGGALREMGQGPDRRRQRGPARGHRGGQRLTRPTSGRKGTRVSRRTN